MWSPSAPEVFGTPDAPRASSSSRIARATSSTRLEFHAFRRIEIQRHMIGGLDRLNPREPRILGDRGQLRHVQQRRQVAADDLLPRFGHPDRLDAYTGRDVLRAMLVEGLRRDAVGIPLHHQGTIRDGRQNERRDLDVIAEQVALGELLFRPEDLV